MSDVATFLVAAGGIAPIGAILGAAGTLWLNRNNAVKVLSEAQQLAQKTALDSAHDALDTVQKRCSQCEARLEAAEARAAAADTRATLNEQRLAKSEDDHLKTRTVLRALVRVVESGDPASIAEAVAVAKQL